MWNGVFAPIRKHRDYQHRNFVEHELGNGGYYIVTDVVYCDTDPVTGDLLSPSEIYYVVEFHLHNGDTYDFLVPAESDQSAPNRDTVTETVVDYVTNPVEGGRKVADVVDLDEMEEEAERLERLRRKLTLYREG